MKTPPASPFASLPRTLGPVMAAAIVVGTVIGSGVFKKPAVIAQNVHYSGLIGLVWVLGGVLVLLGALAYAEVAVILPRAGGNYVFLREGYGRLFGFLWGWVDFWIIRTASMAALATIFVESLADVLGAPWGRGTRALVTVAVLLGLALLNARGTRLGGGVQVAITAVKVLSLLALAALPFLALAFVPATDPAARPDTGRLAPLWPDDWTLVSFGGLGTAFLGVLWAYHGWMNVAPVAEEVERPQRNLPLALLGGVAAIVALYLSVNLAYHLILPRDQMAAVKDTTVAAECCRRLLGPAGAAAVSAAVMCSVFGALNGNLLVGPRLLYAMGADGLAPPALRKVHPAWRTPALAIFTMAGWSSLQVVAAAVLIELGVLSAGKSYFDVLTDFAMFGAVIFETMAVVSVFIFRRTMPDAPRPYRCVGYPVVPALYVILPGCVVVNMFLHQRVEALTGVGFILLGVAVYFALGLGRTGPPAQTLTPPDAQPGLKVPVGAGVRLREEGVV